MRLNTRIPKTSVSQVELEKQIKDDLRDFSNMDGTAISDLNIYRPFWREFSFPFLVFFVLRDIMGFSYAGKAEKIQWSIYCMFRNKPIVFEFRKSGFTISYSQEIGNDLKIAITKLQKAIKKSEKIICLKANEQIGKGNITLRNHLWYLESKYEYFRLMAKKSYAMDNFKGEIEGSYNMAAMIDSFFSYLEHLLTLILPFIEFDPIKNNLEKFIMENWDYKFKFVFSLSSFHHHKKLFDDLKIIKEQIRNPLSHGGFDKESPFLVQIPKIGAVPVNISYVRNNLKFKFFHNPTYDSKFIYEKVCTLFDEVKSIFKNGETKFGYEYVSSGLDVCYDIASREEYKNAMSSEKKFKEYMDEKHYWNDIHKNMDY